MLWWPRDWKTYVPNEEDEAVEQEDENCGVVFDENCSVVRCDGNCGVSHQEGMEAEGSLAADTLTSNKTKLKGAGFDTSPDDS